jgi:putative flippase GtrA
MQTDIIKWGLKAAGGLAANIVLLTLWVDAVGLPPSLAIAPNFVLISATGYTVADRWIWPEGVSPTTWRGHARQYVGMQTANMAGKVANYLVYLVLLPVVAYQVAWVVGAVATFMLTFAANRWWWRGRATV